MNEWVEFELSLITEYLRGGEQGTCMTSWQPNNHSTITVAAFPKCLLVKPLNVSSFGLKTPN